MIITVFVFSSTQIIFSMIETQTKPYTRVIGTVSSSQSTINQLANFTRELYHNHQSINDLQEAVSLYKNQTNNLFIDLNKNEQLKQEIPLGAYQNALNQFAKNLENPIKKQFSQHYSLAMESLGDLSNKLSNYNHLQWQIIQSETIHNLKFFLGFIALSILAIILGSLYISTIISKPLKAITQAIKAFEMGNLNVNLPAETQDELGNLSKTLGSLMRYLNSTFKALDLVINELKETKASHENNSHAKIQHFVNASQQSKKPLETILNQAFLMSQTPLSAEQSRYAQSILDNAKQLSSLVNDTIECSMLESGNEIALINKDFSITGLMTHIKSVVKPFAMDKRLRFAIDCDQMLRESYVGDEEHIEQLIVNMLLNAIKVTDTGKITLKIVCYQQMEQADILLFLVSDTGPGIAADRIPALFDMNAIERQEEACGLGLAKGKQVVEKMQGNVGVYSSEGKGSTFWFTVKLSKTMQDKKIDIMPIDMPTKTADILIVEDNIFNQKTLYHLLQQAEHECDIAKNGVEALEKMQHKNFDIIIMDLHMPEMDGFITTTKILEACKREIPIIIAISADNSPQDYAKCIQHGMYALLGKPIPHKKLLQMIKLILEKSKI